MGLKKTVLGRNPEDTGQECYNRMSQRDRCISDTDLQRCDTERKRAFDPIGDRITTKNKDNKENDIVSQIENRYIYGFKLMQTMKFKECDGQVDDIIKLDDDTLIGSETNTMCWSKKEQEDSSEEQMQSASKEPGMLTSNPHTFLPQKHKKEVENILQYHEGQGECKFNPKISIKDILGFEVQTLANLPTGDDDPGQEEKKDIPKADQEEFCLLPAETNIYQSKLRDGTALQKEMDHKQAMESIGAVLKNLQLEVGLTTHKQDIDSIPNIVSKCLKKGFHTNMVTKDLQNEISREIKIALEGQADETNLEYAKAEKKEKPDESSHGNGEDTLSILQTIDKSGRPDDTFKGVEHETAPFQARELPRDYKDHGDSPDIQQETMMDRDRNNSVVLTEELRLPNELSLDLDAIVYNKEIGREIEICCKKSTHLEDELRGVVDTRSKTSVHQKELGDGTVLQNEMEHKQTIQSVALHGKLQLEVRLTTDKDYFFTKGDIIWERPEECSLAKKEIQDLQNKISMERIKTDESFHRSEGDIEKILQTTNKNATPDDSPREVEQDTPSVEAMEAPTDCKDDDDPSATQQGDDAFNGMMETPLATHKNSNLYTHVSVPVNLPSELEIMESKTGSQGLEQPDVYYPPLSELDSKIAQKEMQDHSGISETISSEERTLPLSYKPKQCRVIQASGRTDKGKTLQPKEIFPVQATEGQSMLPCPSHKDANWEYVYEDENLVEYTTKGNDAVLLDDSCYWFCEEWNWKYVVFDKYGIDIQGGQQNPHQHEGKNARKGLWDSCAWTDYGGSSKSHDGRHVGFGYGSGNSQCECAEKGSSSSHQESGFAGSGCSSGRQQSGFAGSGCSSGDQQSGFAGSGCSSGSQGNGTHNSWRSASRFSEREGSKGVRKKGGGDGSQDENQDDDLGKSNKQPREHGIRHRQSSQAEQLQERLPRFADQEKQQSIQTSKETNVCGDENKWKGRPKVKKKRIEKARPPLSDRFQLVENMTKEELSVTDMRSLVPELFREVFHDGNNKVKKLWAKKPLVWPTHIPFTDPNNGKKIDKDGLFEMFTFLRNRYVEEQRRKGYEPCHHPGQEVFSRLRTELCTRMHDIERTGTDTIVSFFRASTAEALGVEISAKDMIDNESHFRVALEKIHCVIERMDLYLAFKEEPTRHELKLVSNMGDKKLVEQCEESDGDSGIFLDLQEHMSTEQIGVEDQDFQRGDTNTIYASDLSSDKFHASDGNNAAEYYIRKDPNEGDFMENSIENIYTFDIDSTPQFNFDGTSENFTWEDILDATTASADATKYSNTTDSGTMTCADSTVRDVTNHISIAGAETWGDMHGNGTSQHSDLKTSNISNSNYPNTTDVDTETGIGDTKKGEHLTANETTFMDLLAIIHSESTAQDDNAPVTMTQTRKRSPHFDSPEPCAKRARENTEEEDLETTFPWTSSGSTGYNGNLDVNMQENRNDEMQGNISQNFFALFGVNVTLPLDA